jgi:hypothetical protein
LFSAAVVNVTTAAEIKLTQNGTSVPFTLNNGNVQAVLSLVPGLNTFNITALNGCGTQTQTLAVTYNNCVAPTISLMQPTASGITVNDNAYQIQCSVNGTVNSSNITLKVNGVAKPFQFSNGLLTSNITLNQGLNSINLSVSNSCGSDAETFTITYKQCLVPSIVISNPVQLNTTTTQNTSAIAFTAINCTAATQLSILQNGVSVPFTFTNGSVSLTPTLIPGLNTFVINATNDCGTDIASVNITYDNCIPPVITISSPIPSTTANQTITVSATLQHINNANQIALLLNGIGVPFTYANGNLSATLNLIAGLNTLSLTVSNACGSDAKAKTIDYTPCKAPTASILQPTTAGLNVSTPSFTFKASLNNVDQSNQVSLSHNGISITNFQLSNGLLTAPLTLTNGINTIVVFVNNGCGIDQATTTVQLSTCNSPTVTINSLGGQTVSTASFNFDASVQEVTSTQSLTLMVNGQVTPLTLSNGQVSATVTLQNGVNNIMLSATNGCGTDSKSIQLTYIPCVNPTIVISQANNTTVTSASFNFNAMLSVSGLTAQQISLTLNGNPIQNVVINGNALTSVLTLQPGVNSIVLNAQNTCGSAREELTVNYQNCITPSITFGSISDTVTQGIYAFSAAVNNMPSAQGISLTVNGQAIQSFNYANGTLSASIILGDGNNSIVVNATNPCGNATQSASIFYDHCQAPVITINSLLQTSDGNYQYNATIQNMYDVEGLYFTYNGQNTPFNFVNGVLTANVTLTPGATNVFYLTATNNCGTDSETSTVNFINCIMPDVTINGSIANGSSTTSSSVMINASIAGYDANTSVQVTKNGNIVNGLSWTTGSISQNVNLADGLNTFVITATNACGTDTETYTVTQCKSPTVSLMSPSSTVSTASLSAYVLTFNVQNVSNSNELTLTQNGVILSGLTLAGNIATLPVLLQSGANNFNLAVNTACGAAQSSFTINYTANITPPPNNTNDNGGGHAPSNVPTNNNQQAPANNTNKGCKAGPGPGSGSITITSTCACACKRRETSSSSSSNSKSFTS